MTTIAYRDSVMACDSCWTHGDVQMTSLVKIIRLASGALLGEAGDCDSRHMRPLLERVKSPDKLPTAHELSATKLDYEGLLVLPRGKVYVINIEREGGEFRGGLWECNRGFAAVGSGGHVALGAMAAGKSARDAVAIACRFDVNSKMPVHAINLKGIAKTKA